MTFSKKAVPVYDVDFYLKTSEQNRLSCYLGSWVQKARINHTSHYRERLNTRGIDIRAESRRTLVISIHLQTLEGQNPYFHTQVRTKSWQSRCGAVLSEPIDAADLWRPDSYSGLHWDACGKLLSLSAWFKKETSDIKLQTLVAYHFLYLLSNIGIIIVSYTCLIYLTINTNLT